MASRSKSQREISLFFDEDEGGPSDKEEKSLLDLLGGDEAGVGGLAEAQ